MKVVFNKKLGFLLLTVLTICSTYFLNLSNQFINKQQLTVSSFISSEPPSIHQNVTSLPNGKKRCALIDCDKNKNWMEDCELIDYHYSKPHNTLYYHVYWKGEVHWMLPLLIKSYLVTQQLNISKLIVWSPLSLEEEPNKKDRVHDQSLKREPLNELQELRDKFPDNIELRVFEREELIKGTCMEKNEVFNQFLKSMRPQLESDVVRVLLLNRFGGVWMDSDILLMKDLMNLISAAREFSTHLGGNTMNNHILHINRNSGTGKKLTEALCGMIQPNPPVKPSVPSWILNDALSLYCNKILKCELTGVHRCLTDPQWLYGFPSCRQPSNLSEAYQKLSAAFVLHHRLDDCKDLLPSQYIFRYINVTNEKMDNYQSTFQT